MALEDGRLPGFRRAGDQGFDHLGFTVEHLVLPAHTSQVLFVALLAARNRDNAHAAVIAQLPVPGTAPAGPAVGSGQGS